MDEIDISYPSHILANKIIDLMSSLNLMIVGVLPPMITLCREAVRDCLLRICALETSKLSAVPPVRATQYQRERDADISAIGRELLRDIRTNVCRYCDDASVEVTFPHHMHVLVSNLYEWLGTELKVKNYNCSTIKIS